VLPSPKARVKLPPLLVDDYTETMDASPPAAPDMLPAVTLNAPTMLVLEPTEIAMLPPSPDPDKQFRMSKAPLSPALTVPVLNDRSPDTPAVPAMLVNTATVPELVAVPTAVPVLNDRSPDTPAVPAMLVDTATFPELVAVPTAIPVLYDRSPDTPTVPAMLVNTATVPELVALPTAVPELNVRISRFRQEAVRRGGKTSSERGLV
jgi:hypothetical protein